MRINIIIPDELLKKLDILAEREYMNRTEIIKQIIKEYVKRNEVRKMTKIYYVKTNAYNMIVTDHGDYKMVISNECAILEKGETPMSKIKSVEDDSSWEKYESKESIEEFLNIDYNDSDSPRILAETEIEI